MLKVTVTGLSGAQLVFGLQSLEVQNKIGRAQSAYLICFHEK